MDDAWLHTVTHSPAYSEDKLSHKRRVSLLEGPIADSKPNYTTHLPIEHTGTSALTNRSPPKATLCRRAQSYSDFYDAVRRLEKAQRNRQKEMSHARSLEERERYTEPSLAFENHFAGLQDDLFARSRPKFTTHIEHLQQSRHFLENLLLSVHQTSSLLLHLTEAFRLVEDQTSVSRKQCQSLMSEQKRLQGLVEAIDENSRYYHYLEPMTRRLNAPNAANLVRDRGFSEMLSNLDSCLEYMEMHPEHRESATYRSRYRLLLTRALTLVRHHITKALADIAADVTKRVQGSQLKDTTHSALLYAKFRVSAPELRRLGQEIQKRAIVTAEDREMHREPEYLSLMRELYQSYAAARSRLILPLISKKLAELQLANSPQQFDVLSFAQESIGYIRGICLDEYGLWYEWFEAEGILYEFLESLLEPLYDYLRPRIIHEMRLERLCDLCSMIQSRYMDLDPDGEDEMDDSGVASPSSKGKLAVRRLDFGPLVQPALEDAQTRLVFLTMNVLRDSIENYKAKPVDLEWPKRAATATGNGAANAPVLSGKRTISQGGMPTQMEEVDEEDNFLGRDGRGKILAASVLYPTLRKAIWLLRRIYRLVNSTVFDDLAHRIVYSTIHSLLYASQLISKSNGRTLQDGQLFLITHLLHLKQQIVAFDIEFIPPEVEFDFSSITNTFYELRDRGSLWNPTSWVRLLGGAVGGGLLPKVVKNMLDAKAELDGRLRSAINDFVSSYATHISAPVNSSTVVEAQGNDKHATAFDASKAIRTIRGLAEKDVPVLRAKLTAYINDGRTRETLVAAVRDEVILSYEEFFDRQCQDGNKRWSRKGKGRENEVWDPSIFSEAMERIFQVGQVVGDDANVDDDATTDRDSIGDH